MFVFVLTQNNLSKVFILPKKLNFLEGTEATVLHPLSICVELHDPLSRI